MTLADHIRVVPKAYLAPDELAAVELLADVCNAEEGLDLKLNLVASPVGSDTQANVFLAYDRDSLVGFCSLDGNRSLELCCMVHPQWRRKGIGYALLDAGLVESRRREAQLLLICEAASQSGQGFVASVGGQWCFAEHRMVLGALQQRPVVGEQLRIRVAGPEDMVAVARAVASAFGDEEAAVQRYAAHDLADAAQRVYLALLGNEPVGALRAISEGKRVGIYGFGVRSSYQGRGFGRQLLTTVCAALLAEGQTNIFLEVETENARALALYQSCGFKETTTYGYYRINSGEL